MKQSAFEDEKKTVNPALVVGHIRIDENEGVVLCSDELDKIFYLLTECYEAFEEGTVLDTSDLFPLEQADLPVKAAIRKFLEKGDVPDV